jgi:hypothetical protein
MTVMSAEDARRAMQAGQVPARLRVEGDLFFFRQNITAPVRALPPLALPRLALPPLALPPLALLPLALLPLALLPLALPAEELVAESITIQDASLLTQWPGVVRCHRLFLWRFQLDFSPDALVEITAPTDKRHWIGGVLHLQDCPRVTSLPNLRYDSLYSLRLENCPLVEALPAGLRVNSLDVSGCPRLRRLPDVLHATTSCPGGCPWL